jgi:hypothetical protein
MPKSIYAWRDGKKFFAEHDVVMISAGLDEVPMGYKNIELDADDLAPQITECYLFFLRKDIRPRHFANASAARPDPSKRIDAGSGVADESE